MPVSVKCTNVDIRANGSRTITFDDGATIDFPSLADVVDYGSQVESNENARRILVARYIKADPDGSDTAAIVNRTCTINAGAPSPVQIG